MRVAVTPNTEPDPWCHTLILFQIFFQNQFSQLKDKMKHKLKNAWSELIISPGKDL